MGKLRVSLSATCGEEIPISTASHIGECAVNGYTIFMNWKF